MRAVHIAVIRKEHDMRIVVKPFFAQRAYYPPEVNIEILDHRIIPGQLPPRPLDDARDRRYIGP